MKLLKSLVLLLLVSAHAQAGIRLMPMAGLSQYQPIISPSAPMTFSRKVSYGMMIGLPLKFGMDLEFGYLLKDRFLNQSDSSVPYNLDVSYKVKEIPAYLRLYLTDWFHLGLGGYYAIMPSKFRISGTVLGTQMNEDRSFSNTRLTRDYGLSLSTRIMMPIMRVIYLFVDARYNFGMKDLNTDNSIREVTRDISAYGGILFNL